MPAKLLYTLALPITCLAVVAHSLWLGGWMLDDAFIFFRYAENWALGHGLVFNPGEAPVEGFTSFLWTALLAGGRALGFDLVPFSVVVAHLFAFATLALIHQSHRFTAGIDRRGAAIATLFLGTCGVFTPWARSGMETVQHTFLLTALLLVYLRAKTGEFRVLRCVLVGLLCTLLGMSRPDGLLVVAVLGIDAVLAMRRIGWRPVVITGVTFVLAFGAYFAWRYSYFGFPFPNTFYAKVGSTSAQLVRGLDYVADGALALAPLLLLPLLIGRNWRQADRDHMVLPSLLLVYAAYLVLVGGDVMPAHRFFTPIAPAVCLLAAMALGALSAAARWVGATATVFYGLSFVVISVTPGIRPDVVAFNGRIAGLWLREHAPKDAVIAVNAAGAVVYYSGLRAIDMLGLNDLHIAHVDMPEMGQGHAGHEKGDGAYVLGRRPEFIQLGSSLGWVPTKIGGQTPPWPSGKQMWADPQFHAQYKLLYRKGPTVWASGEPCGLFGFYVRKDVYDAIDPQK